MACCIRTSHSARVCSSMQYAMSVPGTPHTNEHRCRSTGDGIASAQADTLQQYRGAHSKRVGRYATTVPGIA
eukprot:2079033-Rhodomonas_salina.1